MEIIFLSETGVILKSLTAAVAPLSPYRASLNRIPDPFYGGMYVPKFHLSCIISSIPFCCHVLLVHLVRSVQIISSQNLKYEL